MLYYLKVIFSWATHDVFKRMNNHSGKKNYYRHEAGLNFIVLFFLCAQRVKNMPNSWKESFWIFDCGSHGANSVTAEFIRRWYNWCNHVCSKPKTNTITKLAFKFPSSYCHGMNSREADILANDFSHFSLLYVENNKKCALKKSIDIFAFAMNNLISFR